jgi:hypothetical protein
MCKYNEKILSYVYKLEVGKRQFLLHIPLFLRSLQMGFFPSDQELIRHILHDKIQILIFICINEAIIFIFQITQCNF